MGENEHNRFAPKFGAEINIESIISAPLIAASKANVMILVGQANFLLDNCFEQKGDLYQPIMVEMLLTQPVMDHTKQPDDPDYISIKKMAFQVPLLCLLPLNSIAVDKVNVDFDLEITSIGSYQSNTNIMEKKAVLNGRVAPASNGQEQYNTQSSSRLKVNIHVDKLPLSKGLLSILDMYTNSIQPVPKKLIKE